MAKKTFRDKSTLSRFENGKTTPADVGTLVTQYEAVGDPVESEVQLSSNAMDAWVAGLWGSLGVLGLVAAVVPDDTGTDVIRVGALIAAVASMVFTARALRYRVISPWLGASGIVIGGGSVLAVALRLGEPAQGLNGGDGIVLLIAAACALLWLKQDVEPRIQLKRADRKITDAGPRARAA